MPFFAQTLTVWVISFYSIYYFTTGCSKLPFMQIHMSYGFFLSLNTSIHLSSIASRPMTLISKQTLPTYKSPPYKVKFAGRTYKRIISSYTGKVSWRQVPSHREELAHTADCAEALDILSNSCYDSDLIPMPQQTLLEDKILLHSPRC